MYAWIFRSLPGPAIVRVAGFVLVAVLVVAACLGWIFPEVARMLDPGSMIEN